MSGEIALHNSTDAIKTALKPATGEPAWVKWFLVGTMLVFLTLFLVLPLAVVLCGAFEQGLQVWWRAIVDPDALAAIRLTLLVLLKAGRPSLDPATL